MNLADLYNQRTLETLVRSPTPEEAYACSFYAIHFKNGEGKSQYFIKKNTVRGTCEDTVVSKKAAFLLLEEQPTRGYPAILIVDIFNYSKTRQMAITSQIVRAIDNLSEEEMSEVFGVRVGQDRLQE